MSATQNRSHAVMAQRSEPSDSLDFFPTPPWATRAFCEHILKPLESRGLLLQSALEPACGDGAMAKPLAEYFDRVDAADIHPYGYGRVGDFLAPSKPAFRPHWVITNPPFRLGEEFVRQALSIATHGVAVLVRTAFLESQDRFRLYSEHPPSIVAQYVERVPMVKGRLDRKASTATAYCWIIWRDGMSDTRFRWIPPSKKEFDRNSDWPAANCNNLPLFGRSAA